MAYTNSLGFVVDEDEDDPVQPNHKFAVPPPARLPEDKSRKPRWDLVRFGSLNEIAEIMALGEGKHADTHGWAKKTQDDHFASLMRHLSAWRRGEKIDPEFGKPHLSHAFTRLMMLLAMEIGDVP